MAHLLTIMINDAKNNEGKEYASSLLHPAAYLFTDPNEKTKRYKPALASLALKDKTLKVIFFGLSNQVMEGILLARLAWKLITFVSIIIKTQK